MTATPLFSESPRKRLLLIATLIFALIGALYAAWWFVFAARYESTDDAYVHGNLVQVTSQIPGTIVAIDAEDTQRVHQGDALLTLDPSDTRLALEQAKAALAQTVRRTRTLFVQNDALAAEVAMRKANIEQAQTVLNKAESDLQRRSALGSSGGVSGEELLHARIAVKSAQAGIAQAQAAYAASSAKLQTNQALTQGSTVATHPDVLHAADQVRKAWLAEARTRIVAPVNGMVAQRTAQLGQHIQPGTPLMTIVPLEDVWVEANFKENQIHAMKPGQKATITSDLYGSAVTYHGTVVDISAGSGGAFSLLPAQNASGNWIKVIQRIPVRIRLDPEELRAHPLRVGLSMQVEVALSGSADDTAPVGLEPQRTTAYTHDGHEVDALVESIIRENLGS
ncbi:HlyD family efflux transporter periplasmic adaptor subunit [Castellaniella sp. S9]|uniref:HlyD family efflux transporter periplasmic adaptor subunit n=1 Tax=Castellaniella sp. S9 TaxID=2993652 RepID=UPI0022B4FD40|nr:HlyD family efflux transporter periplasmic adaptor subunit [Castellaniella sp. S9]